MAPATIQLIITLVNLAVQYAPQLAEEVQLVIGLINQEGEITPEQQAQVDAALDKANQALQDAVKAKLA